ncbi:MAG: hypothetical protein GY847_23520 [Proteobacteria bacterium]|nr:hypothetical protein [Pseudomonadota bacterium]
MSLRDYENYDVTGMVAKPLYFGMLINVMVPGGLLFVCFYVNQHYPFENRISELANGLFYALAAISIAQAGFALWWRHKKFGEPMVRKQETMEKDMIRGTMACSRPAFLLIASISLWGFVYFWLTGRFEETSMLVIFSFLVFQVVRPRHGAIRKLIDHQTKLVEQGFFAKSHLGL